MSDDKILKTAVALAEKEVQEKEINRVKEIVKDYLRRIKEKTDERAIVDKELSLLKKDLDDFKAGRLDKVAERQKIEPLAPKIVIITRIEKEYIPARPWYSPFEIQYPVIPLRNTPFIGYNDSINDIKLCHVGNNAIFGTAGTVSPNMNMVANVFKNFAGGAYNVDGNIVNL